VTIKYTYHHFTLQDPPNFSQIWIFGLKTNHLATLLSQRQKKLNLFSTIQHMYVRTYVLDISFALFSLLI
jgi:hypothetical protein